MAELGRNRGKILLVDDDPDILNLVRIILEGEDYEVYSVRSGEEALEEIGQVQPDLIILDIVLPGMDGYDILRILKSQVFTKGIPVIILSIRSSVEERIVGLNVGADDYITKPFDPAELAARVEAVLRGYGRQVNIN